MKLTWHIFANGSAYSKEKNRVNDITKFCEDNNLQYKRMGVVVTATIVVADEIAFKTKKRIDKVIKRRRFVTNFVTPWPTNIRRITCYND